MIWSEVETKGTPPSPCYGHTANYIGNNKIVFFGGKGFDILNSFSIFDVSMLIIIIIHLFCQLIM
jgi:hypothetical protein